MVYTSFVQWRVRPHCVRQTPAGLFGPFKCLGPNSPALGLGKVHLIRQVGGGMKISREAPKIFRQPKGGLKKNCWARRECPKICVLSKPTGRGGGLLSN